MRVNIPIKLESLANTRLHWRRMVALKKEQRLAVKLSFHDVAIPPMPLLVVITRIGPRRLDDDNLASACKYVRDAIAGLVGIDDGSDQYTWRCEQRSGSYGVEVEITNRE